MTKRRIWKGLLAGGAAGAAGSLAMNQFKNLWTKVSEQRNGREQSQSDERASVDATVKVAAKVAEITGHRSHHGSRA